MAETGLAQILESVLRGVEKMLTWKKFMRASYVHGS